ncbi:cytidine deaminase-like protein [Polychytrium aggregatum]|uniref:cytidine deaminase-like protein n=1 Tax=Polychytrium aggregatum TaxID=110093 RepID=UPI0022FE060A|nr:cytidine deaminase-like protein [Polychytrium aggregatum]KAI9209564.1 cytidine deaminase-like protein [Polychytrium aggregatum]
MAYPLGLQSVNGLQTSEARNGICPVSFWIDLLGCGARRLRSISLQPTAAPMTAPPSDRIARDSHFMQLAVDEANKSIPVESAYCVGALLVKDGVVLSTGFSRELPGNTHAEECCLIKLKDQGRLEQARGSTCYSTMEPCGERLSGKWPCCKRLVEAGVARVVVGIMEPTHFIQGCVGVDELREAGIAVDVLAGWEEACLWPNRHLGDKA